MEWETAVRSFLETNLPFVPQELWLQLFVVLSLIVGALSVLGRATSAIMGLRTIFRNLTGSKEDRAKARVLRAVWLRDRSIWNRIRFRRSTAQIPIISFLNMKGGVGKTTLSANIGAHLSAKGARVLFVDFDYQGTLSLMVASTANRDRLPNNAYELLQNNSYKDVSQSVHKFKKLPRIGLFAAHYLLFRDEMELFANWAANNSSFDIRFALQKILHSRACAEDWDVVIVDCGPRFTTSTINALCASTHIVIPTILDEPSAQAVGYLSKEFEDHKQELFPDLNLLGVIPTLVAQDPPHADIPTFSDLEQEQLEAVEEAVEKTWGKGKYVLEEARIPKRAQISKNADKVAYVVDDEAKRVFGRAGDILIERLRNEGFRTSWTN
ncbi:MAG: ParA family protein [Pseudomonadota bacterium]